MAISIAPSTMLPTSVEAHPGLSKNMRNRFIVKIDAGTIKANVPIFLTRLPHLMVIYNITLLSASIVAASVKFGLMDSTTGVVWAPGAFALHDLSAATTSALELYAPGAAYPTEVTANDFKYKPLMQIMKSLTTYPTYTGFPAEVKSRLEADILTYEYGLCMIPGADVATAVEMIFDIQFAGI